MTDNRDLVVSLHVTSNQSVLPSEVIESTWIIYRGFNTDLHLITFTFIFTANVKIATF